MAIEKSLLTGSTTTLILKLLEERDMYCLLYTSTIGSNTVIGAGSVVNRDIPDGVVAVGNPCRVLRKITEEDKKKYWKEGNK